MSSILNDIKKALNLDPSYTAFDQDIIMHINGVFSTLNQLGVGPAEGYRIMDAVPEWTDFVGDDPKFHDVQTYVFLRVRLLFDPPQTSFLMTAYQEQIAELTWRLNVKAEQGVVPTPIPVVLDGGDAEEA